MKVLLTNDDGIQAQGLQTLRRALVRVPGIELVVIAPDGNRSAMARSITTMRPLCVDEVDLDDGTIGYATDGTPVDCVRLANLGLVDGFEAELIVSGINHGANLGDDITYSGTVAAALEGVILGLPAIAVSQQSDAREMDLRLSERFSFDEGARFVARVIEEIGDMPLPTGTLLNVNCPAGEATGVQVTRLGKRIYRDELTLTEPSDAAPIPRAEADAGGAGSRRRRYWVYGRDHGFHDEPGTDLAAVAAGDIAVTPLHFDLTDAAGMDALERHNLGRLLAPAAEEVE